MRQKWVTILIFVFCYSLIIYRWLFIPITKVDTQARIGVYGDAFSSRNVHSAAAWFHDKGIGPTKALPVLNYTNHLNNDSLEIYTHYPPLPDILGGAYATILNTNNPYYLAIFPLLLSTSTCYT